MIYTHIPYLNEDAENLGVAYNEFMQILNDDDWACFIDHDAMFTTNDWYDQLNKIINKHPSIGVFGVRTNRIGNRSQLIGNIDIDSNDINYHREIGKIIQKKYYLRISPGSLIDDSGYYNPCKFSGVVILIQKKIWNVIGGFKTTGFIGVDDDLRVRLHQHNIPFAIMDGIYVYHWYRQDNPYISSKNILDKIRESYREYISKNEYDPENIMLLSDEP